MSLQSPHRSPGSLTRTSLHERRRRHRYKRQETFPNSISQIPPVETPEGRSVTSKEQASSTFTSSSTPESRSRQFTSSSPAGLTTTPRPTYDSTQSSLSTSYPQSAATSTSSADGQPAATATFLSSIESSQNAIPTTQITSQPSSTEVATQTTVSREHSIVTSRTATFRIGSTTRSSPLSTGVQNPENGHPLSKPAIVTILVFAAFFLLTIALVTWRKVSQRRRKHVAKKRRRIISPPLESRKNSSLDFTDGGRNSLEKQDKEDESYSYNQGAGEDDDQRRMVASYYYEAPESLTFTPSSYNFPLPPTAHQASRTLAVDYGPPERSPAAYSAHRNIGTGTEAVYGYGRTLYSPHRY